MVKNKEINFRNKIQTQSKLRLILEKSRKQGKAVAFTNGCFDILHAGHVQYLEKARRYADILVVGLNSDTSVKKIKGQKRPLNAQRDRAVVLGGLSCVDYITIFNEETPLALIEKLKPDVLIKGGDWQASKVIGSDIVKGLGGKVIIIPYLKGRSTTGLIKKIIRAQQR